MDETGIEKAGTRPLENTYLSRDRTVRIAIACHAAHKARNQRRDAEAEQAGGEIADHHQWQHFVVAVQSRARSGEVLSDKVHQTAVAILKHDETQEAGQDHDERHAHLEERTDDGREPRRAQRVGSENALDNKKVCGPVAATDGKAESEDNAGPVNAHGVVGKVAHAAPEVRVISRGGRAGGDVGRETRFESGPAMGFNEAENGNQQRTAPDEDELQNLIENCGTKTAEGDVGGHRQRGDDDGKVQVPTQHHLHHFSHGEHVHTAHEHGHEGKRNR